MDPVGIPVAAQSSKGVRDNETIFRRSPFAHPAHLIPDQQIISDRLGTWLNSKIISAKARDLQQVKKGSMFSEAIR